MTLILHIPKIIFAVVALLSKFWSVLKFPKLVYYIPQQNKPIKSMSFWFIQEQLYHILKYSNSSRIFHILTYNIWRTAYYNQYSDQYYR
jgi:hypothetical protein